ncbi:MAG TPA: DUF4037 domain-containing protein, partial [Anaerolineales bacterium]|nr:DUF4037 domain-containing protein [Anaerolineales bacterium]
MTFIKGLQLSEIFYREAVGPILGGRFPGLAYSAARLDGGSDVLGFDTPRSMDHGWGPRLQLFLSEADLKTFGEGIVKMLGECLPYEFHGFSTNFSNREIGLGWMERITSGPICHGVSVHAVRPFLIGGLGCDPCDGLTAVDWLTIPEQKLRVISSGQIFHDGLGELKKIQAQLQYYPRDVWLYLLAAQWRRIDQEEPFMGRCGEVGDELGSRILTARLIRDVMKLCFLMERQYAPYSKWFGTAFSQLNCAGELTSTLIGALAGQTWQEREAHLSRVYKSVAAQH